MTAPSVGPIAAVLTLALLAVGWWLPWTDYPDGLGGGTRAWLLGPRHTGVVVATASSSVLTVVAAALAVRRDRTPLAGVALSGVALLASVVVLITVDFGMVTWTGRSEDGRWTGGAAPIQRGTGLIVLVLAPAVALLGAAAAEAWARSVRNPTGRTPGPTTPPAG